MSMIMIAAIFFFFVFFVVSDKIMSSISDSSSLIDRSGFDRSSRLFGLILAAAVIERQESSVMAFVMAVKRFRDKSSLYTRRLNIFYFYASVIQ